MRRPAVSRAKTRRSAVRVERRDTPRRRPLIGLCPRERAVTLAIAQIFPALDLESVSPIGILTEVMNNVATLYFFEKVGS